MHLPPSGGVEFAPGEFAAESEAPTEEPTAEPWALVVAHRECKDE